MRSGREAPPLELLAKQKRLARTASVPCVVSEAGGDILIESWWSKGIGSASLTAVSLIVHTYIAIRKFWTSPDDSSHKNYIAITIIVMRNAIHLEEPLP